MPVIHPCVMLNIFPFLAVLLSSPPFQFPAMFGVLLFSPPTPYHPMHHHRLSFRAWLQMRHSLSMQSWSNTTPLTIAALDKYGKSLIPYAVDVITFFMTVFGWFCPSVLQCGPV